MKIDKKIFKKGFIIGLIMGALGAIVYYMSFGL
jgi:hypothetical protein